MKAVCIDQNGDKILVATVNDSQNGVPNGGAELIALTSPDFPETSPEVRAFIDANPMKSLNLHKVVGGEIVLRTPEELDASTFIDWAYGFTVPTE